MWCEGRVGFSFLVEVGLSCPQQGLETEEERFENGGGNCEFMTCNSFHRSFFSL